MIIRNYKVPATEERETFFNYDDLEKRWHIFTEVPKHARKYEELIDTSKEFKKGFSETDSIVMLDGYLAEDCNVTARKKRQMTEEQKLAAAERLRAVRERMNGPEQAE